MPSGQHRTTRGAVMHSLLPATDPGAIRRHTATTTVIPTATAAPCVLSWRQPRASEPPWWHGVRWNQTGEIGLGMQAGRRLILMLRLSTAKNAANKINIYKKRLYHIRNIIKITSKCAIYSKYELTNYPSQPFSSANTASAHPAQEWAATVLAPLWSGSKLLERRSTFEAKCRFFVDLCS